MFVTKVMFDENNEPMKDAGGKIECEVIMKNGKKDIRSFKRDDLIEVGLLSTLYHEPDNSVENQVNDILDNNLLVDTSQATEDDLNFAQVWCEEITRMLLDKYEHYLPLMGPMERFKNKKAMWCQIASDIAQLGIVKTFGQCENHYKTIMKRKRLAINNNSTSGSKRMKIDFEEEISQIAAIDDSLEPEILQSGNKLVTKTKDKHDLKSNVRMMNRENKNSVANILLRIHKEKEESRQRRHEEKMAFLKNFVKRFEDKAEQE